MNVNKLTKGGWVFVAVGLLFILVGGTMTFVMHSNLQKAIETVVLKIRMSQL